MGFNPFAEKGMPAEKQLRNWSELNSQPYDKNAVHPFTRCRVILMNGIEVEGAIFSHQFARHTDDQELKCQLALSRRVEQQQQKAINWLMPAEENVLEATIGYEQVAVELTAFLARNEPDPYVKQALDFGLLEDFDHLYRYANLYDLTQGGKAEKVTGGLTEITVGRPTKAEHRHPFDDVRRFSDRKKADPRTIMHCMTVLAGEQQTMNFYNTVGNRLQDQVGRGLYLEIGQIEEQHVTHYESLLDPRASWFEMLAMHEYNECYLYHSFMQEESDPRIKKIWQMHLEMELEHLRIAGELMKKHEKRDARELFPKEFPAPIKFQSNFDYIRDIMAKQTDFMAFETEFMPADKYPGNGRYEEYQKVVNRADVPSELVIEQHVDAKGGEYRQEVKGPHPLERFQLH
jgi:hypothetical protein